MRNSFLASAASALVLGLVCPAFAQQSGGGGGTVSASSITGIVAPTNGGTGINNGVNTLTLGGAYTINGTTGSTLNIGTGGTLGSNAFTSTAYAPAATTLAGYGITDVLHTGAGAITLAGPGSSATYTLPGSSGTLAALGTNTFIGMQTVNLNAVSAPASVAGTVLQVVGTDTANAFIESDSFGGTPIFTGRRADGTGASPTAVQLNDVLAGFSARPYDGSAYATSSVANIQALALENFTTAHHGAGIAVNCTAITTLTTAECARFTSAVFTAPAIAINGATLGTNALAVTGSANINGLLSLGTGNFLNFSGTTGAFQIGGVNKADFNITSGAWSFLTSMGVSGNFTLTGNTGIVGLRNNSTIISSPASAVIYFGAADAASPVAQTTGVQGVVAGTSNTPGALWTFHDSVGTGTGASGGFAFQVAAAGSSGGAQNTWANALTIAGGTGVVNLASLTASKAVFTDASKNLTSTAPSGFPTTAGTGISIGGNSINSNAVEHVSYQPGLLTAVNATKAVFHKYSKAATVDNLEGSAATFSCVANPTITMYECGTDASCTTTPTTIGTVTVTSAGTVVDGTVSNPAIAAGDYVAFAMSAGTCASIDVASTAQVHSN